MEQIPHNPTGGVYSTGGDWLHALEVRGAERMLFVSGTMGLRPDFTAPPTLEEQLECVWNNLRTIFASAGMTRVPINADTYNARMPMSDLFSVASPSSNRPNHVLSNSATASASDASRSPFFVHRIGHSKS